MKTQRPQFISGRASGRRFSAVARLVAALILSLAGMIPRIDAQTTNELSRLRQEQAELRARFRWREAAAVAARVVEAARAIRGEAHPETTAAMYEQAWLVNCAGDNAGAERIWRQTLVLQERLFGSNSVEVAVTLRSLGDVRQYAGDYLQARQLLLRAVTNFESHPGKNDIELGKALRSLGVGHVSTDDWEKAESYYRRSVDVLTRVRPESPLQLADSLTKLGQLRLRLSDPVRAEPVLKQALEIRTTSPGSDDVSKANLMGNLAEVEHRLGNVAEARALYERSLRILDEALEPYEDRKRFHALLALGNLLSDLRELDQAEPLLKRALEIARSDSWTKNRQAPIILAALGVLEERKGDYLQSRRHHEEAYRLYLDRQGPMHSGVTSRLRALSRLDLALGDMAQALSRADEIQDGEERWLAEVLSFTSEQQRLAFHRDHLLSGSLGLWATMGAIPPLARTILRTKGIVLDSLLEERLLAEAGRDPALRATVKDLSRARSRLAGIGSPALYQAAGKLNSPGTTGELLKLTQQVDALESTLARHVAGFGRARRALSVEPCDIATRLPADTVLLEFIRYKHYLGKDQWRSSYGVLILSSVNEARWVALGPADGINRDIKICQHLVRDESDREALVPLLRSLYDRIWRPVQAALPIGIRRVIISPDWQLNFLSFAALVTPEQRFLGETVSVSYISNGRDLLVEPEPATGAPELLVWANPDFGGKLPADRTASGPAVGPDSDLLRDFRGFDFRRLPGAEKEGRILLERASNFGFARAELRLGRNATEANLNQVQSPRVLHLATHGFVLLEDSETDAPAGTARKPFINPMLRSGLALAGARRTIEAWTQGETVPADDDGIVTAQEIGSLSLRGTQLVVLSACDTGLGDARSGEGVFGLRRGFAQAGARNLLLTLWPIDDERTAGFMPELYAEMNRTGDAAEALAAVQSSWLKRLRENNGLAEACRIAGPFILSFQGKPAGLKPSSPVSAATDREPVAR